MWKALVLAFYLSINLSMQQSKIMKKISTNTKHMDGITDSFSGVSKSFCAVACFHRKGNCTGINYATDSVSKSSVCELLSVPASDIAENLTAVDGYTYYSMGCVLPADDFCKNGGKLDLTTLTGDCMNIACTCPDSFGGKACDKKCVTDICNSCDIPGYDISSGPTSLALKAKACLQDCMRNEACKGIRYDPGTNMCYLKSISKFTDPSKVTFVMTALGHLESYNCTRYP